MLIHLRQFLRRSELIPACCPFDPRWQHIARLRELFLLREHLPPPAV